MSGIVEVFVKSDREDLSLETLGVGSVIGQYSLIDSDVMICGFKAVSHTGALLLSFDKQALDHLC